MNPVRSGFAESLAQVQLVTMFESIAVKPRAVIDADGIHDQSVAFPVPDRMAHESRVLVDIFRMFRSVGVNQSIDEVILEQDRTVPALCTI